VRLIRLLIVMTICALAAPHAALAWENGPAGGTGFGTHDWVLAAGNRLAVSQGTNWLDLDAATKASSEPDLKRADWRYHNYDRWGKRFGYANVRVASLYSQAVKLYRAGDRTGASRTVGLLSHYYADACSPLHTDDSRGETKMHARFERQVDSLMRSPDSYRWWASHDGYTRVSNASAYTVSSAKKAHKSYSTLVRTYNRKGFKGTPVSIARKSLSLAANGIADLVMSIQQDAVEVAASPNLSAHQGVAASNDYNYVFHTTRITRYNKSWNATGTNTQPFAGLSGFTQPHLGDGCYHDGKLYVVAENWPNVSNQHILVFDATTLERLDAIPTGRTHETAGVCVGPGSNGGDSLWIASYYDSRYLFEYSLAGSYAGAMPMSPAPQRGIQGLAFGNGKFYLSVGLHKGVGSLYSVSTEGSSSLVYTRRYDGHHEGIELVGDRLLWLIDGGGTNSRVRFLRFPAFLTEQP
jgi:hypothetical protein